LYSLSYSLLTDVHTFGCRLGFFLYFLRYSLAFVNPDLHADLTICGQSFGLGEINVGAQSLQRDTAFAQPHIARHFRAPQATTYHDLDSLCALANRLLNGALHGAAISNAAFQLIGHILGNQHRVGIRRTDFFDVKINLFPNQCFEGNANLLHALAFASDQDAGLGSMDGNPNLAGKAFNIYAGDAGLSVQNHFRQFLAQFADFGVHCRPALGRATHQQITNGKILMQLLAIGLAFCEPASMPGLIDAKTHTNRMYFATHKFFNPFYDPRSRRTTVICDWRRSTGLKRPRAPKRRHLRVGASFANICATYKSSRLTPKFSSAFATADFSNFSTGSPARLLAKRRVSNASLAPIPRTMSITRRTFWADCGRKLSSALISCVMTSPPPPGLEPQSLFLRRPRPSDVRGRCGWEQTHPNDGRPYFP